MRQQKIFGKREAGFEPNDRGNNTRPRRPIQEAETTYEDPVLVRLAAQKSWPAYAATGITLTVFPTTLLAVGEINISTLLMLVPIMLLVGFILYLQFKGLQRGIQGEKEKRKRALQAKYPLIPIFGMIGGLIYFMVTQDQSLADIYSYDWSGIFGLRTDIEGDEPLPAQLFDKIAKGGGFGVAIAVLWYKVSKRHSAEIA